ncbi:MAG: FAD:protein FMN transferase ApbE [Ignavibacteriae bacterium]|nr:MAG: FAD:protein FMN transferase ApbE [Ignavibacteriota bacterium]
MEQKILTIQSKFYSKYFSFFILFFLVIIFPGCSQQEVLKSYEFTGTTMGTIYSIKIIEKKEASDLESLKIKIDSLLIQVNLQMSTYIDSSEISQFNMLKDTTWFNVSKDFSLVMNQALRISKLTNGYYDVTVGPLVNLWGFGTDRKTKIIPTDEEINIAKKKIGYNYLKVDTVNFKIKKTNKNLYCDLSSIAKGFGVDKVGEFLEEQGLFNYMVEIGGEVRTKGKNQFSEKWHIGISNPNATDLQQVVNLSGESIATSGDYLNYFEKDGIRYSHLINPKTGKPITHNLASVSVIHEECTIADAFATVIDIMGPEKGMELAQKEKLSVFMIVRKKNKFIELSTKSFEKYFSEGK